jgi:hypothetical protein
MVLTCRVFHAWSSQALADADWASVFIWIDIFGINWHATPELADPLNNSTAAMQACAGKGATHWTAQG